MELRAFLGNLAGVGDLVDALLDLARPSSNLVARLLEVGLPPGLLRVPARRPTRENTLRHRAGAIRKFDLHAAACHSLMSVAWTLLASRKRSSRGRSLLSVKTTSFSMEI